MSKFRGSITLSIFSLSTLSNCHYWQAPKTRYWRLVRPYQAGISSARLFALIWAHNPDLHLKSFSSFYNSIYSSAISLSNQLSNSNDKLAYIWQFLQHFVQSFLFHIFLHIHPTGKYSMEQSLRKYRLPSFSYIMM